MLWRFKLQEFANYYVIFLISNFLLFRYIKGVIFHDNFYVVLIYLMWNKLGHSQNKGIV